MTDNRLDLREEEIIGCGVIVGIAHDHWVKTGRRPVIVLTPKQHRQLWEQVAYTTKDVALPFGELQLGGAVFEVDES